jgi:hypothetical protein
VRKSFDVISDELLAELPELLFGTVVSFGFACTARGAANAEATVFAADVPDVAIELSCDKSIARSPYFKVIRYVLVHARTLNQLPPLA